MQKYVIADAMEQEMKLRQLGGKVNQINGKMCYVTFDIGGLQVEYVYNLNSKGQYFLERIKPYPMPVKVYEDESKIVEIIDIDLEQFRSASKSHNVDRFIALGNKFNETAKRFEDLFLYYNVPPEVLDDLFEKLMESNQIIDQCKTTASRIYFKKEPDNL